MRAVLYCRVSTAEQAQNFSLATQEEACKAYCARSGYEVDHVFVDAGESAKTANRPEFLKLLSYCRKNKGRLHAVVVYSLTRFARNSNDHHAIAGLLRGLGISLRSVTEPIDDSSSGRLMEGILAAMAQFDNDVRSERTTAGMKAAVSHGRWCWTPPVGYLRGQRGGPSLEHDPVAGPLVRRAFELVADRTLTGRPLRRHLTGLGLRGRNRGRPLTLSRLYNVLRNPVYAGRIESGDWGTATAGDFPPLVSAEVFARAQLALSERGAAIAAANRYVHHPDFPLRRFVRCAKCAKGVTGSWSTGNGGRYAFYHCLKGCTRIRREALEQAFLDVLNRLTPAPDQLALFREVVLDVWREEQRAEQQTLTMARQQAEEFERKLARLEQLFIFEQRIDDQTYQRQRDELRERITLARMATDEGHLTLTGIESLLAFAEHALAHAATFWTGATSGQERARVQTTFFPEGLDWSPTRRRTGHFIEPRSCFEFFYLGVLSDKTNGLVTPPGPTWNQVVTWLRRLHDGLSRAA